MHVNQSNNKFSTFYAFALNYNYKRLLIIIFCVLL